MLNTTLAIKRAREMRKAMTPPEAALWARLRAKQLAGLKFRRQHPLGPYVLDFFCPAARLAVEVDGRAHHDPKQAAHDDRRDNYLRAQGVETLRVAACDIHGDVADVLRSILHLARTRTPRP